MAQGQGQPSGQVGSSNDNQAGRGGSAGSHAQFDVVRLITGRAFSTANRPFANARTERARGQIRDVLDRRGWLTAGDGRRTSTPARRLGVLSAVLEKKYEHSKLRLTSQARIGIADG